MQSARSRRATPSTRECVLWELADRRPGIRAEASAANGKRVRVTPRRANLPLENRRSKRLLCRGEVPAFDPGDEWRQRTISLKCMQRDGPAASPPFQASLSDTPRDGLILSAGHPANARPLKAAVGGSHRRAGASERQQHHHPTREPCSRPPSAIAQPANCRAARQAPGPTTSHLDRRAQALRANRSSLQQAASRPGTPCHRSAARSRHKHEERPRHSPCNEARAAQERREGEFRLRPTSSRSSSQAVTARWATMHVRRELPRRVD
jgi:hypothetical protein